MGNCLRHHESQVHWGGEDWTPALMSPPEGDAGRKKSESGGWMPENGSKQTTTKTTSMEVKIKISKKQLEKYLMVHDHHDHDELLKQQGLSVQQALTQLIKLSAHCEAAQQRPGWRPRLQSIPEI